MSWDDNPYYHPEKHGLAKVAEADLAAADYSFDMLVVWADAVGFYLGTDSGCSCPSPFEDYDGRGDMTGPLTKEQALEEASSLKAAHYDPIYDLEGWNEFIRTVSAYTPPTND